MFKRFHGYILQFRKSVTFPFALILFYIVALRAKKLKRKNIGIGPNPNVSHFRYKLAIEQLGYKAETYANHIFYISDKFDTIFDYSKKKNLWTLLNRFRYVVNSFHTLIIYFDGGVLARSILHKYEAKLYKNAGIKIIVLAYGSDVQDLRFSRNLSFKHSMCLDYPDKSKNMTHLTAENIKMWTTYGDHIISGCDWVYYTYHWDQLILAHFVYDTNSIAKQVETPPNKVLKFLHAPNHRSIKGTDYIIKLFDKLKAESAPVELILLERKSNDEVIANIIEADIIIDQLIIGWYGQFAVEAMAHHKPVICYVDEVLENLYVQAGLVKPNEIPILKTDYRKLAETVTWCVNNPEKLQDIGLRSRQFVNQHHSIERLAEVFNKALT